MKRKSLMVLVLVHLLKVLIAQEIPAPTSAEDRLAGQMKKLALWDESMVKNLPFTNIGPAICGGRVVDVDVNPAKPSEMYVAYASGGLWYSDNNGTSFIPVFDREASMTIGDIAVNWTDRIIWVGTGENNSSRSSYAGTGIYKSTDSGQHWIHCGLEESHHIGRIVLHPVNPDIVYVACLGTLYSENQHRGVYATSDGGITWHQSLLINERTGAIDLMMDPSDPNQLYCAVWERQRRAWNFTECGPGSGMYTSHDGGQSWTSISAPGSGFPTGANIGRIGLAMQKENDVTILYAIIDNQNERPGEPEEAQSLTKSALLSMSADSFLRLSDPEVRDYLVSNGFAEKYTVDKIRSLIRKGSITPSTLVDYTLDANRKLFDTQIIGTEIYRSIDEGKTWTKTHKGYLDNVFYTYGYYFGQIRTSPKAPGKLYILGVPLLMSSDSGATWHAIGGDNMHGDHHALWVDPYQDGHLVCGNDGGINITYDDGAHWIKCNQPAVGQFYSVAVDNDQPYHVYGGMQDNGVWVGPSTYTPSVSWHATGQYPYRMILGGDGMQVAVDPHDNNTVYAGFQFGNYFKTTRRGDEGEIRITPKHELGESPYRWNWETPIQLSAHRPDIVYIGAEKVFRSIDRGAHFKAISGDLTHGSRTGDVTYGTLVALHESPRIFGLLYAGSDDGYIHVTQDGGHSWERISDSLPQHLWVSNVRASNHADGRVYTSLNGYRWDHFDSYLYSSENFGKNWRRIGLDLPPEPINVILEDPVEENILYIGTDNGLYVSLDRGKHFMVLGDLPFVPVHDLAIQPREKEIIVATHGRSLYKGDISCVEQLTPVMTDTLTSFNRSLTTSFQKDWGNQAALWSDFEEPSVSFPVYSSAGGHGSLRVYADSLEVYQTDVELKKGLAFYTYNLELSALAVESLQNFYTKLDQDYSWKAVEGDNGKFYLLPGRYSIRIEAGNKNTILPLEIKAN